MCVGGGGGDGGGGGCFFVFVGVFLPGEGGCFVFVPGLDNIAIYSIIRGNITEEVQSLT